MQFARDDAVLHVPDGSPIDEAMSRTTHLGIGAHQDDLEIMAIDGILQCYDQPDAWFAGVVVSDGAGSPRAGRFADYTNEQMVATRIEEQKAAADLGRYAAQMVLLHPSDQLKDARYSHTVDDLIAILRATRPTVVYTHNLFDKHDAHVAVTLRVLEACRRVPETERPEVLYGCEVWRDLDWLPDDRKIVFNTTARPELQEQLLAAFESQIAGGKRYDLAAMGRRRAHATYLEPHRVDDAAGAVYACDMSALMRDASMDPADWARDVQSAFRDDVAARIDRVD